MDALPALMERLFLDMLIIIKHFGIAL